MTDLSATSAVVTGTSRGFGRGIAAALLAAGAHVVGVARTQQPDQPGFTPIVGDATDPGLADDLLGKHRPRLLVLNAGAIPPMGPFDRMTWAEFSHNWQIDTRHVFEWLRAALGTPLLPGSRIVVVSSGAALQGSAVSGGYAGAKAAIRFITRYAAEESQRRGLGLTFTTLLPQLTASTDLGVAAVERYAARQGTAVPPAGDVLTPEQFGRDVLGLLGADGEFLMTVRGPQPVP